MKEVQEFKGLVFRRRGVDDVETVGRTVGVRVESVEELLLGDEVVAVRPARDFLRGFVTVRRVVDLTPVEAELVRQGIEYGRQTGVR